MGGSSNQEHTVGRRTDRSSKKPRRRPQAKDRPLPRRGVVITAGLAVALLVLALLTQIHYLVPDSAAYVSYARSILWDGDVDFSNDYARLGMIEREAGIEFGSVTRAGKPGNPFGLGASLLWLPFVALAALLAFLAALFGVNVATDGFGTATLLAAHLGTWSYALATIALTAMSLREALPSASPAARRAGLIGACIGTPFLYYVFQMPSYSHVPSAFVVALLLYLGLRWRSAWTIRRAAVLGAVLGVGGLVRIQELGFWFVPLVLAWSGGALTLRRDWSKILAYGGVAALVFVPQLVAWASIYGGFQIPQGGGFLQFSPDRLWNVLFASRHGLTAWSPVVLLAAAGWVLLAWRRPTRTLGIALAAGFVVQWFVNSLPIDWWAGWSFGARRFTDCVPLMALGLGALAASGRTARIAIYVFAAAGLVQWLRVSSGALSGETDPGWGALWGGAFFTFLPHVPGALWEVARVPWTHVQTLRRSTAVPPSMHEDPASFLAMLFIVWGAATLFVGYRTMRLWAPEERGAEEGSSSS